MFVWNDGSSPLYSPHFEGLAAGRSHTQDDARPGRFRQYVPNVTKCFVNPLHWDEGAGKPPGHPVSEPGTTRRGLIRRRQTGVLDKNYG